jgi:NhaP-type Na+/H+ or K+/H+ antiporter
MVPPIVFEAALNIDKKSFNRMIPIMIYAVFGTLMSTVLTAFVVYYGTAALGKWCTPIPFIESLLFGALISSIDSIAVLSVLSNMGMNDRDVIYVLIFGESLLNDEVAIVLFGHLLG